MIDTSTLAEQYAEEGFLCGVPIFTDGEIASFREKFDALEERLGREKCAIGLLDSHFTEQFVWDLATGPRVLETMRAVTGEDMMLLGTHFFCKYPEKEPKSFVAWHQDVTYWGLEPPEAHTAWIAVDDADAENGAMQVIAGSHKLGQLPHGTSNTGHNLLSIDQQVPDEYVDKGKTVQFEVRAGEMSVHHGYLLHASMPNRSNRRRCGLTARFIPARVKQVKMNSMGSMYKAVLVSGEDRYQHFPGTPLPFPLRKS